jgi:drug/metabolite transporter (DMT)-like permease
VSDRRSHTDPRGFVALVIAVFFFGIAPLFVRAVSAPALTISMCSSWIAAFVATVIAWRSGVPLTWKVFKSAIFGGIAFALTQLLAFIAFQETSLAIATLITTMTPLIVVIAAVPLFGEKMRGIQLVWAALALVGVIAVIVGAKGGGGASIEGDLFAFGSLLCGAGVMLSTKHRRMAGVGASAYAAGVFLVSGCVQTPVWLIVVHKSSGLDGEAFLWIALLGLALSLGLAFTAWAQRHVSVGVSSVLGLGGTVVTAAGAWLIFGQPLQALQIVGGVIVLVSLGLLVLAQLATPMAPMVDQLTPDIAEITDVTAIPTPTPDRETPT